LTLNHEDLDYLKACAALGVDPSTGNKVSSGNGHKPSPKRTPRPERKDLGPDDNGRAAANAQQQSLDSALAQRESERRRENLEGWFDYYRRNAAAGYRMYHSNMVKAKELEGMLGVSTTGGGGEYAM